MNIKKSIVLISCLFAAGALFAQEAETEDSISFDNLFEDVSDVDSPVVTDQDEQKSEQTQAASSIFKMNGSLRSEVGCGYLRKNDKNSASFYFDFYNIVNFSVVPDKYLSLNCSLVSDFPFEDKEYNQNSLLYVKELYFNYYCLNHFCISAGKKDTVWGNVRLFTDSDSYSDDDALYTNLLHDSVEQISGVLRASYDYVNFTAVCLYGGVNKEPSFDEISFAANAEFVVPGVSFNLFGRSFAKHENEVWNGAAGVEFKTVVLGFDIYGQSFLRFSDRGKFEEFIKSKAQERDCFNKSINTAGFFRIWTVKESAIGLNAEFQNVHYLNDDDLHKAGENLNRFALNAGVSKLGPEKNINVGLTWKHDITNTAGELKTGIVLRRVLPHCDWKNGVEWQYGSNFKTEKIIAGTYLTIGLNY